MHMWFLEGEAALVLLRFAGLALVAAGAALSIVFYWP